MKTVNFISRWMSHLLPLALMLLMAACSPPTSADLKTSAAFGTWACKAYNDLSPFLFIIAAFFGMIGGIIAAVARLGSTVLGAGFLAFAQNNLNNIIIGVIILVAVPVIVAAVFGAIIPNFQCELNSVK